MKLSRLILITFCSIAIHTYVIADPSTHELPQSVIRKDTLAQERKETFLPIMSEPVIKDQSNKFTRLVKFYFYHSNFLFRLILFLNLFFLSSAILLIMLIFLKRLKTEYVIYQGKKYRDRYSTFISQWIYEEDNPTVPLSMLKELENPIPREVFTSELFSLHDNLSGESAEKLEDLFLKAGLKKYSIQKIHSYFWHIKAKGIRELAQMKINSENQQISKYLNSKNLMLRLEAMLAWIQLNPEDPLSNFDDSKTQFTEWGQINSLIALKKLGQIPDFSSLMQSSNKSAVVFALKMAGIFKQFETAELVIQRLYDTDDEIRRVAIITLGLMELPDSGTYLADIYPNQDISNKIEILHAMIMSEDSQNADFFKTILLHETDITIRILSAKGLIKLGKPGEKILEDTPYNQDTTLSMIISHAKDQRN